jgi:hypothetical protein
LLTVESVVSKDQLAIRGTKILMTKRWRARSELGFATRIQYPGRFTKTGNEIGDEKSSGGSRGDLRPKLPFAISCLQNWNWGSSEG